MNNKKRTDLYIPIAIEALQVSGIANGEKIDSSYRSQISSFGAAVAIGSFKQAVAFFAHDANDNNSKISRSKLIVAIDYTVKHFKDPSYTNKTAKEINETVLGISDHVALKSLENEYLDAAVALKVAMGIYDMGKGDKGDKKEEKEK